ncbi:hypothetical protein Dimus_010473 [Dionaea muscipula]
MSAEAKSSSVSKVKPSSGNRDAPAKVKSESSRISSSVTKSSNKEQLPDSRGKIGPKTPVKSESNTRTAITSTKTTTSSTKTTSKTKTTPVKRERKVFTLPGQRYDPPEERDPLRIFYSSLSEQIPSSEMAEIWLLEHGLLSPERAKKAYEKKQRKQKQNRTGTPIKFPTMPSKPEQKQASKNGEPKAKKRIASDSDDDEYIASPKRRRGNI